MPWIALAIIGGSAYQANQQRKAAQDAKNESARQAAAASKAAEESLAVQRQQAAIAQERLATEVAANSENRARLETQAKQMASDLEAQQRQYAEAEAQRLKAARRGGRRSLISDQRLNPELGLGQDQTDLGSGVQM